MVTDAEPNLRVLLLEDNAADAGLSLPDSRGLDTFRAVPHPAERTHGGGTAPTGGTP